MAPPKIDPRVAKEAKQKKILIVLSIVLVAVMAIQLPKLMGGKKSSSAAPTATTPGTPATPGAVGAPSVTPTAPGATPSAKPGKAQLASFSLFDTKDPFVQQLTISTGTAATGTGGSSAPAPTGAGGKPGAGTGGKPVAAAPTFATITVNGEPEAVVVKGDFPKDEPLFRLVAVAAKTVKIGIAGGKLAHGKTITLRKGAKLTLVDTATGARYTLELVYTGTTPEVTEVFSSGQGDAAGQAGATDGSAQTTTGAAVPTP